MNSTLHILRTRAAVAASAVATATATLPVASATTTPRQAFSPVASLTGHAETAPSKRALYPGATPLRRPVTFVTSHGPA